MLESDLNSRPYRISEAAPAKPKCIVACRQCGFRFSDPQPDWALLRSKYESMEDPEYSQEEAGRRETARRVLKAIARYRRTGRLLDVGCACGFLMDEARRMGWEVFGVELSLWAASRAKNRLNLPVTVGTIEDLDYPKGWFDIIVLVDVIEHLPDPRGGLDKLRQLLSAHGVLAVLTPDVHGLSSRLLQTRWWGIQESHFWYFDRNSLRELLRVTGFVVQEWSAPARAFSWAYWTRRLAMYLPRPFRARLESLSRRPAWRHSLVTIPLFDQVGCIARRSRTVGLIPEWENVHEGRFPISQARVTAVLPAYNAAETLAITVRDIPKDIHEIILVDDASQDETASIAKRLGLITIVHSRNRGYGSGQKTGYREAIRRGSDIVVMIHPDYQYDPKVLPQMITPIQQGSADAVFGSRMMKEGALEGGMPYWKWAGNIFLTAIANIVTKHYLTEYHSGFRAYRVSALKCVRFEENSDGFVFDTQIILQLLAQGFRISEIPIRTRYFDEASTIRRWPAFTYGLQILFSLLLFWIHQSGVLCIRRFTAQEAD